MARCHDNLVELSKLLQEHCNYTFEQFKTEIEGLTHTKNAPNGYITRLKWEGAVKLTEERIAARDAAEADLKDAMKRGDQGAIDRAQSRANDAAGKVASVPAEFQMAAALNRTFKDGGITGRFMENLDHDGKDTILTKLALKDPLNADEQRVLGRARDIAAKEMQEAEAKSKSQTSAGQAVRLRGLLGNVAKEMNVKTLAEAFRSKEENFDVMAGRVLRDAKGSFKANVSDDTWDALIDKDFESLTMAQKTEVVKAWQAAVKERDAGLVKKGEKPSGQQTTVQKVSAEVKRQAAMKSAEDRAQAARDLRTRKDEADATKAESKRQAAMQTAEQRAIDIMEKRQRVESSKQAISDRRAKMKAQVERDPSTYARRTLADALGGMKEADRVIAEIGQDRFDLLARGSKLPDDMRISINRVLHDAILRHDSAEKPAPRSFAEDVQDAIDRGRSNVKDAMDSSITVEEHLINIRASKFSGVDKEAGSVFITSARNGLAKLSADATRDQRAEVIAKAEREARAFLSDKAQWGNDLSRNIAISGVGTLDKVYVGHPLSLLMDAATMPVRSLINSVWSKVTGLPRTEVLLNHSELGTVLVQSMSGVWHDLYLNFTKGSDVSLVSRALTGDDHALHLLKDDYHPDTDFMKNEGTGSTHDKIAGVINTTLNMPGRSHNPAFTVVGRASYFTHRAIAAKATAMNAVSRTAIGLDVLSESNIKNGFDNVTVSQWNKLGAETSRLTSKAIENQSDTDKIVALTKAKDDQAYEESKATTNRNETYVSKKISELKNAARSGVKVKDQYGNERIIGKSKVASTLLDYFLKFSKISTSVIKANIDASGFGAIEGGAQLAHMAYKLRKATAAATKNAETMTGLTPEGKQAYIDACRTKVVSPQDVANATRVAARGVVGFTVGVLVSKWLYDHHRITPTYAGLTQEQRQDDTIKPGSIDIGFGKDAHGNHIPNWVEVDHLQGLGNLCVYAGFYNHGWAGEVNNDENASALKPVAAAVEEPLSEAPNSYTDETIRQALQDSPSGQKALARFMLNPVTVPLVSQGAKALDHDRQVNIRTDSMWHTLKDTAQSNSPWRGKMDGK